MRDLDHQPEVGRDQPVGDPRVLRLAEPHRERVLLFAGEERMARDLRHVALQGIGMLQVAPDADRKGRLLLALGRQHFGLGGLSCGGDRLGRDLLAAGLFRLESLLRSVLRLGCRPRLAGHARRGPARRRGRFRFLRLGALLLLRSGRRVCSRTLARRSPVAGHG